MERLAAHTGLEDAIGVPIVVLLDRVWRMYADADAATIMTSALYAQVGHLARLPVSGGWMMRFLKELPTFEMTDEIAERPFDMLDEDMSCMLAMRRDRHGVDGDAVHADARRICDLALRHMPPARVCLTSIRAYRMAGSDVNGRRTRRR